MARLGRKRMTPAEIEFNRIIGMRVEGCRRERKWSAMKFATQIGVSTSQVYKYETGEDAIPLYRLHRICVVLGLSLAALLAIPTKSRDVG